MLNLVGKAPNGIYLLGGVYVWMLRKILNKQSYNVGVVGNV